MVDSTIIAIVRRYLQRLNETGVPVSFGVLFGSQVTGNVHEWSDIDVLVVSPLFDERRTIETVGSLWRMAYAIDNRIEPIACGLRQWTEDDFTPIYEVAREEGLIITPEESLVHAHS
jgi:uncharacterized protein